MLAPPLYVKVNLRCADGTVDAFKMNRQVPLSYLADAYCFRTRAQRGSVALRLNGKPVSAAKSPEDLALVDGDCLEVVPSH